MAQQRQTSETNKPAATATAQMPAGQAGPAADNAAVARPDPSAPAKAEVAELLRGEVDIDKLTYAQLRALAAELGVDVWDEKGKSLTDIQLREALNRPDLETSKAQRHQWRHQLEHLEHRFAALMASGRFINS